MGNKDIKLINEEFRAITGIKDFEASWQTISQEVLTPKNYGIERTKLLYRNVKKNRAQYEMLKQQAAPTGHVGKLE